MLACDTKVTIFIDHRNLLFVLYPHSMEPSLGRHKDLKVLRWALFMSTFSYKIEHVPVEENTMADILTRCMRGYPGYHGTIKKISFDGVTAPPVECDEHWPDRKTILEAQLTATDNIPRKSY